MTQQSHSSAYTLSKPNLEETYGEWNCYEHGTANVSEILSSISLAIGPELLGLMQAYF